MRIDPSDENVGLPAVVARDLLRRFTNGFLTVEAVCRHLDVDEDQGQGVATRLAEAGLIEPHERTSEGEQLWVTTTDGNALANATAAARVKRSTAERALSEFLDRVREVNVNDEYVFQVDEVIVFGSYLDDSVDRLSDVDVVVELSRRHPEEEFRDRSKARVSSAQDEGRRFSTTFELVTWPKQEVLLHLKGRSPVISMIEGPGGLPRGADHEVVYRRPG